MVLLFGMLGWGWAANPSVPEPQVRVVHAEDGVRIEPDRAVPVSIEQAESLLLEFGETSLFDLTLFFADVRRLNFLIAEEEGLKSKTVMLIGHQSMGLDAAWEAYLSALRAHGFTTSQVGELVTVVPSGDARRRSEEVRTGAPVQEGERIVTQLLVVENARAADLLTVVKPLASEDAEVMAYAPANTLIVTDSASNVKKIADLVQSLAVAAPTTELRQVTLSYARASAVRTVIEGLYPPEETKKAVAPRTRRRSTRGKTAAAPSPATAGAEGKQITRIIEDERSNSLFVLANASGHDAIDAIVAQLDVDQPSNSGKLHVVRLKYALAEEVQAVLASLAGSDSPERPAGRGKSEGDLGRALDSGARIAADPATNSLAILAEPEDFEAIQVLLDELDTARRQVFVDAVFVDLTTTGGREVALSAHVLGSETQPLTASSQTASDVNSFTISTDVLSGLAAGVFGQLVDVIGPDGSALSVPTFGITLRALQTHSNVHVMGNPALLVLDHQEATLTIGSKIPFATSNSLSNLGVPITNYERVEVGTELTVTPHINDGELVTLDVELVVDEVESSASESNNEGGPTTTGRSITSRVMIEDGQTIVLAGVTSTKLEMIETKVPILGDIPLIGAFFRGKRKATRDANLLVFLTPYIVESPGDLLRVRRIKEAQRSEFVRRFQGRKGESWLTELQGLLASSYDLESPES